ncbi:hypothetical protein J4461_01955 [Candidatus Pacearchaeota archaeon]|nr:hypothetical protein [Candidatus Pacearchaeota archaeon]
MTEDLKEFDNLIKEKNISDVDRMTEESKRFVKEKIPNLNEKYKEVVIARGRVIEASIILETAFDELITKTGGEDLVINPEKKEFHLITGAKNKNELGGLGFNDKIRILKNILKKMDDEVVYRDYIQSEEWKKKDGYFINYFKKCSKCGSTEQLSTHHIHYENFGKEDIPDVGVLCWYCQLGKKSTSIELPNSPEPPLLSDLEKISKIRDIFAHVTISWLAKELEFDDSNPCTKHLFKLNPKWKNLPIAFDEFMNLQKEILVLIPVYIKNILLKREIFSNILLGGNYNDVLKKYSQQQETKK